jgi:hypothetical protein
LEANKKNGYAFIAACTRVENQIAQLIQARGVLVGVEIDRVRTTPEAVIHQIELTYGRRTRLVSVDHDTFMDAEFFRTLILHQLETAIEELASDSSGR